MKMNKLYIIGNLTRDPEIRTTTGGNNVCDFTVAVNRRARNDAQPEADFFRVTAWNQMADICHKYLAKGRKVAVVGPVSVRTYQAQDGSTRASLEVRADDVEFLTPKGAQNENNEAMSQPAASGGVPGVVGVPSGFVAVETDELPF